MTVFQFPISHQASIHVDTSPIGDFEKIDASQERGLPGAAGAYDADDFSFFNLEVNSLEDLHPAGIVLLAETLRAGRMICEGLSRRQF